MEVSEGVISFDFEGGLDAGSTNLSAAAGPVIQPEFSAVAAAVSHSGLGGLAAAPIHAAAAPGNVVGGRSFRRTVCRHWLRGLCMKGDACGFLHQFDKSRMPVCRYFRLYGECREQDCVYKHSSEDIKDCNMYKLGFCPNGPDCRYRHAKSPGPPPPVEDVLLKIQRLPYHYSSSNRFCPQNGNGFHSKQKTTNSIRSQYHESSKNI